MNNQYGLSRDIPEDVKREIRQRCGFGCVVCASSIIDYEHVEPTFAHARRHDPAKMALLCPMCHARVTRNQLSKSRIQKAMAAPKCREQGFSFSEFDAANTHPFVTFAGCHLMNCPVPIQVHGMPLFKIEQPEIAGGPYRLSASFYDKRGVPSLMIRQNEWRASSDFWDVEVVGGRVTVRQGPRDISLQILFVPAMGIVVERVNMYVAGYHFVGDSKDLVVHSPGGGSSRLTGFVIDQCAVGMSFG
jgi:hypothetical protein